MLEAFWCALERFHERLARRELTARQAWGLRAENLACRHLESLGYLIIERNWFDQKTLSEIDIIAHHEGKLVFVEVKARESADYATPEIAMHGVKRAALLRGISAYARKARAGVEDLRLDVVTVVLRDPPEVRVFPGEPIRAGERRNAVC
ncbi:MAG: YraN family protein [Bryobacteraceae bacterium]|nr:YraN family protein [Solibacteraceae bacterium]MCL4844442.1 YraN family protein [Bryobacteraceae bacterium]MCO5351941.1 YraN family protein [Bryobacteraceae bacterium]